MSPTLRQDVLSPDACAFYQKGLRALNESHVPFLIGGAYAFECYTQIARHTKDLDIFARPQDCTRVLQVLATAGYQTDLTFPHWLGKAFYGENFIDVIFSSGNGVCTVDDEWFAYAIEKPVLEVPARLCPAEEMIWSKAFVEERERYDGADIAHILRARCAQLDWARLLHRFDAHWRVLLSHLVLFGFVYPVERSQIPHWVMQELLGRLQQEFSNTPPAEQVCQGTLLSREQYLIDIMHWGYRDARLFPSGPMTPEDIAHWTAAIGEKQ